MNICFDVLGNFKLKLLVSFQGYFGAVGALLELLHPS